MPREDLTGQGVYRLSDGKLVKRCNTLHELIHTGETTPSDDATFLDRAGFTPLEQVAGAYTIHVASPDIEVGSAYREGVEGIRYLILATPDPQAHFYIMVGDSLAEYLEILELLKPLAWHKRQAHAPQRE